MKSYPSIDKVFTPNGQPCYAFYKYDGSNLRVEWSRKTKKWYKWGTRRRLFDKSDAEYGCAIEIFNNKYAEGMERILTNNSQLKKHESVVVFMEFFGPHSFAGQHAGDILNNQDNNPKDVVVFDVNLHKKGFLSPQELIVHFGCLDLPQVIYNGPLTQEFVDDVRHGKYELKEGVVCKGGEGHSLWMKKIKTLKYLEELKLRCGPDWEKFWE